MNHWNQDFSKTNYSSIKSLAYSYFCRLIFLLIKRLVHRLIYNKVGCYTSYQCCNDKARKYKFRVNLYQRKYNIWHYCCTYSSHCSAKAKPRSSIQSVKGLRCKWIKHLETHFH